MPEWSPLVDIIADDREHLFKADLPEMKKDDVKVTIENGVLYISGERKTERKKEEKVPPAGTLLRHIRTHIYCAGRRRYDQDHGSVS